VLVLTKLRSQICHTFHQSNLSIIHPFKTPININTIRHTTGSLTIFPQPHNWPFISWDGYTQWYRQRQFRVAYKYFWTQSSLHEICNIIWYNFQMMADWSAGWSDVRTALRRPRKLWICIIHCGQTYRK